MIDWSRSIPLTCIRCEAAIAANCSSVNESAIGSGPSEAMPGTVDGSFTT